MAPIPTPAGPSLPAGGPWIREGRYYWLDEGYEADLERAVAYICRVTRCPNLEGLLIAQSREETAYGQLFTKPNNFWNMGATDDNPQGAPTLPTPKDGGQCWLNFLGWYNPGSSYARAGFVGHVTADAAKPAITRDVWMSRAYVFELAVLIKAGGWATDPTYPADVAGKL